MVILTEASPLLEAAAPASVRVTSLGPAVFMPHDIQVEYEQYEGQPTSYVSGGGKYFSTGLLETALRQGYQPFVICPCVEGDIGPQDYWWISLAGRQNVFFITAARRSRKCMGALDPDRLDPVRQLFERLGKPWPEDLTNWTLIRSVFERLGLMNGSKLALMR